MKKLSPYLSAGIAATATFQSSDAATIVTLYGPGSQNIFSTIPTPLGISIGFSKFGFADRYQSPRSFFNLVSGYGYFTQGSDFKSVGVGFEGGKYFNGGFMYGAQMGSANYANISFNGNDSVYEAVGQFYFDGLGGGYLVAIAKTDDNSALSISAGKAAIAAVPEPSAIALLSLGAGGLMLRRRRKVA